jgi:hypothetical protein
LGIFCGVTPALGGEICQQVVDSDSVRSGRASLDRRDIDLGHKETLRIVNAFSERGVAQRNAMIDAAIHHPANPSGPLVDKRIVVATDGGRLRERRYYLHGRRRKNGHRGFAVPWREPRQIVIYVIDDDGNKVDEFRPIYDATIADCEVVFDLILGYLKALGAHLARELTFVADGAKWIWERTADLAADLGIVPDRVTEVVDWYHAIEKLGQIADVRSHWRGNQKRQWLNTAKGLLYQGRHDELIGHIESLAIGRKAQTILSHVDYFDRNRARMRYKHFAAQKLPRGSGVVESAIRRVINLRMKSNAKFWKEENAQGMLLLRSYLKAQRFDDLFNWSISTAVPWWPPAAVSSISPILA